MTDKFTYLAFGATITSNVELELDENGSFTMPGMDNLITMCVTPVEEWDLLVGEIKVFRIDNEVVVTAFPAVNDAEDVVYTGLEYENGCVFCSSGETIVGCKSGRICSECSGIMFKGYHPDNECPVARVMAIMEG